jgi:hypothetical protein
MLMMFDFEEYHEIDVMPLMMMYSDIMKEWK